MREAGEDFEVLEMLYEEDYIPHQYLITTVKNKYISFADGGLIAPNGKPSNLTAEQYAFVRSPAFKKWFGDWENDPENASKVVDENGEPLVVYHGSKDNKITTFEFKIGKGIYSRYSSFTENKKLAESYGTIIYEVFLKIEKPYIIQGNGEYIWKVIDGSSSPDTFFDENVPLNYNGIIFQKVIDFNGRLGSKYVLDISDVYMVRNSNQIKLADGTNTTFDAENPDIRYAKGGQFNRESGLKKLAKEKKATITNAFDQLKKSMLADQYKIVRTSEFKNWFGDWQKDPNNCSVIREKNGEPMVVWHGSPSKFNIFKNVENGVFYFAENAGYASHFADDTKNTYPYFLNIRKIFDAKKFDIKENEVNIFIKEFGISTKWLKKQEKLNKRIKFWELLRHDEDFRKYLIKQGYDGIRYVEDNDDGWIEKSVAYGCFNANQIKLANGVNTTFSTKSKDIRYADGGVTEFNKKMQGKDYLPYFKEEYSTTEEINKTIAAYYLQEIAKKYVGWVNEIEFVNESKNPRNHFQLRMYLEDKILWTAPFIYVDDNHKVVAKDTKIELLDRDYETIKYNLKYAKGGLSKTPAPKKDRVFGSDKNKVGSAASDKSAKEIRLDDTIVTTLQNKAKEYNKENSGNKVTLNTLKAVMRRGMGAYSTSHRPTITGGAPNSRQAWGFARVNKFLKKKSGEKVKKAYIQDDDLLADGGLTHKNNLKMTHHNYQSMKPIGEIQVGDIYLIKEDMFAPHQDHEHPQHLSTRYATVEVKSPCHKSLDAYVLEVMDCDCDHAAGKYAKGKIIERSRKHILSSGKLKSAVAKNEPTEKIGLDDIYMGDSINYDGKTYEVGGLSDCRTKVKIKFDDNESNVDIDDVMDRAILIKRGN
jgi:hypothetical protein